ncbi:MAG: hypothetical protein M3Y50_02930 [Acidobacteriota bacterium]|nr:hypothetical protein [Acidobacteriota bacterium]
MNLQISQTIRAPNPDAVLRLLETCLCGISLEVSRDGDQLTASGIGPSDRTKNRNDKTTLRVTAERDAVVVHAEAVFQASALMGDQPQDEVVRLKLDRIFDCVKTHLLTSAIASDHSPAAPAEVKAPEPAPKQGIPANPLPPPEPAPKQEIAADPLLPPQPAPKQEIAPDPLPPLQPAPTQKIAPEPLPPPDPAPKQEIAANPLPPPEPSLPPAPVYAPSHRWLIPVQQVPSQRSPPQAAPLQAAPLPTASTRQLVAPPIELAPPRPAKPPAGPAPAPPQEEPIVVELVAERLHRRIAAPEPAQEEPTVKPLAELIHRRVPEPAASPARALRIAFAALLTFCLLLAPTLLHHYMPYLSIPSAAPAAPQATPAPTAPAITEQPPPASTNPAPQPAKAETTPAPAEQPPPKSTDTTPATETPSQPALPSQPASPTQPGSVVQRVLDWGTAMRSRDPEAQTSFYSVRVHPYYENQDVGRDFILSDKQADIRKREGLWAVKLENIVVEQETSSTARVRLVKHYIVQPPQGAVIERFVPSLLHFKRVDGQWYITAEHNLP